MAQQYTRTAIGLHWIIALLIFAAFGLGWVMTDIPGFTMMKLKYYSWHKWLGVTVFALAFVRVFWRLTHPAPAMIATIPRGQQLIASGVHWLLYFLIFAVPLSGYFYSLAAGFPIVYLGIIPIPSLIDRNLEIADTLKTIHVVLDYTMAGLVGLHILGALKHHIIDRDATLTRMLPFLKR
ncbi:cytochrome b [Aquirhabdus parva]|uniref:Cytochrome b n=1 Tax=Aquirhabdus parva TaxID=2283318 RepID=A0A345P7C7_9GAMM|nr:cytochrome b [Aquirhabdus parva]AXI03186.1 cytochrome b [Aquirhabdus parva]